MSGADWNYGPVSRLYKGLYDGPHATPRPSDEGPIFLGIKNVTEDGHLDLSTIRHIAEEDYAKWTRRVEPREGDIVFTYEATLNRYAIIPQGFRGCLGRRMALIRPNPERVDTFFLFYYFFSPEWREVINKNKLAGATVDRIPLSSFPEFPVRAPSLSAQRRIAGILSAYDELIENSQSRIRILEAMARALYREWFVHFRFPGHEHHPRVPSLLGEIPEGWEVKKLYQLAEIRGGTQLKKEEIHESGEFPVFGGNGIQGYAERATHKGFVVAFGRVGAHCGNIHWSYGGAWLNNNSSSVVPSEHDELVLHHLLGFDFSRLRGGSAQPFISNAALANVEFLFPGDALAKKFCSLVKPLRLQKVTLERQVKNLRRTRDLLLPRLLSGQLEIEVA